RLSQPHCRPPDVCFFNGPATTAIYTLSLHDALPICGCDKTVPAQLMGAASANIPAVQLVTGPMSTGRHRGERLGACTDCRRFWRSEEHTSELQSQSNLVCRLLLEKKKKK